MGSAWGTQWEAGGRQSFDLRQAPRGARVREGNGKGNGQWGVGLGSHTGPSTQDALSSISLSQCRPSVPQKSCHSHAHLQNPVPITPGEQVSLAEMKLENATQHTRVTCSVDTGASGLWRVGGFPVTLFPKFSPSPTRVPFLQQVGPEQSTFRWQCLASPACPKPRSVQPARTWARRR